MPLTLATALAFLFLADTPKQVFDNAVAALSKGDYSAAERGFQQVLRVQPSNIGALGNLGVIYARTERFAEAGQTYRKALALAPDDPGLLVNLGLSLLKQEHYTEALAPLGKLVQLQPAHRQANELLATAQLHTGDAKAAVARLATVEPSPGVLFLLGVGYLKLGERQLAARMFEQLTAALPAQQASFLRGKAFYDSGLFDEAAKELEPIKSLPEARRELGKVYLSQRRGEDAEREFTAVLSNNPGDREAAYYLGALLVERGEVSRGEPLLRTVAEGSWGANYYLGKAALKQKRVADALRHLALADRLQPGEPNVLFQLFRAQQAAGDKLVAAKTSARLKAARDKQREGEQAALVLR